MHTVMVTSTTGVDKDQSEGMTRTTLLGKGAGSNEYTVNAMADPNERRVVKMMNRQMTATSNLTLWRLQTAIPNVQILQVKNNCTKMAGSASNKGCKLFNAAAAGILETISRTRGFPQFGTR